MPSSLGRYAVRRRIGAGGFATVWLAYDEQLDSPVAVKVLADNWTEDAQVRARFTEEGRYLRRVDSPYVVTVHDAGELDDGRPYLVMTYADQGTLADRLEVEGLTVGQALVVLRQVASGLQDLHDHDILHRDVKPANVLFRTGSGRAGSGGGEVRAMLGDLGLGKALDVSSRLTMIAGTPSFVAPEQAQAEPLDARADQYSLAALAYLLLAGRPPYSHTTLAAAASPVDPPPLSTPARPFPVAVEAVVRRGLARDREDRYPTVTDFVTALERAMGDPDSTMVLTGLFDAALPVDNDRTQPGVRPTPRPRTTVGTVGTDQLPGPQRRRGRRALALTGVALLCLVGLAGGIAGGFAWQRSQHPDVTLSDRSGSLSVTVPDGWDHEVADQAWQPPNSTADSPSLSTGTARGWASVDSTGQGIFVALLPGEAIPPTLPQHPECHRAQDPVTKALTSGTSVTVVHTQCTRGPAADGVTVERVVQVADNLLLWVQIRAADTATAFAVLDSVATHGT